MKTQPTPSSTRWDRNSILPTTLILAGIIVPVVVALFVGAVGSWLYDLVVPAIHIPTMYEIGVGEWSDYKPTLWLFPTTGNDGVVQFPWVPVSIGGITIDGEVIGLILALWIMVPTVKTQPMIHRSYEILWGVIARGAVKLSVAILLFSCLVFIVDLVF